MINESFSSGSAEVLTGGTRRFRAKEAIHSYCSVSLDFDKFEDDATPRRIDCSSVDECCRSVCFAAIYRVLAFRGFVPHRIIIVNRVIRTKCKWQLEKDQDLHCI